jgi:hypothetical protein
MRGAVGGLVAFLVTIGVTTAYAVQPAKHNVDWYRTHQQARDSVLATCQNDHSFDESGDCRNAQSASHGALADSLSGSGSASSDPEATVAYYGKNGGLIAMVLNMCARQGAARAPEAWCQAASTASANLHR